MGNHTSQPTRSIMDIDRDDRFTQSPINDLIVYTEDQIKDFRTEIQKLRPDFPGIQEELSRDLTANLNNFKEFWDRSTLTFRQDSEKYKEAKKMKDGKDFPDECHVALICYTDGNNVKSVYKGFNEECRKACEGTLAISEMANRSLFYLMSYVIDNQPEGVKSPTYVYRGVNASLDESYIGEHIGFGQFTSTTSNLEEAKKFGSATLMVVENIPRPADLPISMKSHSVFPAEEEYLLSPFLVFTVVNMETHGSISYVYLEITTKYGGHDEL